MNEFKVGQKWRRVKQGNLTAGEFGERNNEKVKIIKQGDLSISVKGKTAGKVSYSKAYFVENFKHIEDKKMIEPALFKVDGFPVTGKWYIPVKFKYLYPDGTKKHSALDGQITGYYDTEADAWRAIAKYYFKRSK